MIAFLKVGWLGQHFEQADRLLIFFCKVVLITKATAKTKGDFICGMHFKGFFKKLTWF